MPKVGACLHRCSMGKDAFTLALKTIVSREGKTKFLLFSLCIFLLKNLFISFYLHTFWHFNTFLTEGRWGGAERLYLVSFCCPRPEREFLDISLTEDSSLLLHTTYQCCGSGMFIPDPGSWFLPIPDPGSRIGIRNTDNKFRYAIPNYGSGFGMLIFLRTRQEPIQKNGWIAKGVFENTICLFTVVFFDNI